MVTIRREVPVDQVNSTQPGSTTSIGNETRREDFDMQMQLRLLEQQNKQRLMMAREEQNAAPAGRVEMPRPALRAPVIVPQVNRYSQDAQFQLMLSEQQNQKRLMMARLEQNTATQQQQHAQTTYHQESLEHQNKFKLMLAGKEQDKMSYEPFGSPKLTFTSTDAQYPSIPARTLGNHALQDYKMQLMLLEQQNKKRLMLGIQRQEKSVSNACETVRQQQATQEQFSSDPVAPQTNEMSAPTQVFCGTTALLEHQLQLQFAEQRTREDKERDFQARMPSLVQEKKEQLQHIKQEQEERFAQGLEPCPEKRFAVASLQTQIVMLEGRNRRIQTSVLMDSPRDEQAETSEVFVKHMTALEKADKERWEATRQRLPAFPPSSPFYASIDD